MISRPGVGNIIFPMYVSRVWAAEPKAQDRSNEEVDRSNEQVDRPMSRLTGAMCRLTGAMSRLTGQ